MSPTNSLRSITSAVLFVPSQMTRKSVTPRRPCTSLRKGSTKLTNCALVNSSLNSKSDCLAAIEIVFSSTMNKRRTLILSNADACASNVLSPNSTVPCPGNVTTGLTPAAYRTSRSALRGLNANLITFLTCPREKPAGEYQGSLCASERAIMPAVSPFSGT